MGFRTLEVERYGAVLRVDLNRPERLNALGTTALEEIAELFTGLQSDFDARVVVLGGVHSAPEPTARIRRAPSASSACATARGTTSVPRCARSDEAGIPAG